MQILLQPPRLGAPSFEVDFEIQKALVALHGYSIKIGGAGRFGDGSAAIVLQRDNDAARALAALKEAGIRASSIPSKGNHGPSPGDGTPDGR